jgi:hypothetical protein
MKEHPEKHTENCTKKYQKDMSSPQKCADVKRYCVLTARGEQHLEQSYHDFPIHEPETYHVFYALHKEACHVCDKQAPSTSPEV